MLIDGQTRAEEEMPTGLAVHGKQGKHHLTLIPSFTNPVRFFPYAPLIDSMSSPRIFTRMT